MNNDGEIDFRGTLKNTGNSIALDTSGGVFLLDGGVIDGGTIDGTTAGSVITCVNSPAENVLDGVTLNIGLVSLPSPIPTPVPFLTVVDGLTLNGTATLSDGSALEFTGTETLGGAGQFVFGKAVQSFGTTIDNQIESVGYNPDGSVATLTIGPSITITGQSLSIVHQNYFGGGGAIINQGLISSGGSIVTYGNLDNQGTLRATSGSTLDFSGLTNEGTIEAQGGTVHLLGYIALHAGSSLMMSGNGEIDVRGTLDNTGSTINLDTSGGRFVVQGGTLQGGTITASSGSKIVFAGYSQILGGHSVPEGLQSTLNGVTINVDLDVTYAGETVTVLNGLTLNGTATLDNGGQLYFTGTQELAGAATIAFGPDSAKNNQVIIGNQSSANVATLTLGPSVRVTGRNEGFYQPPPGPPGSPAGVGALVNLGTIEPDSGGSITMALKSFDNAGTVYVNPATLNVSGDFTQESTGSLTVGIGGLVAGSQLGQVNVKGRATLGGTLNTSLLRSESGTGSILINKVVSSLRSQNDLGARRMAHSQMTWIARRSGDGRAAH
ncbi:MAG: hypothetical protein ACHRXM_06495 [Isosphaerales bacterium]